MLSALVILSSVLSADAVLNPNYPINAQLPPVARVSQPFRFQFASSTFAGSDSGTSYSLSNAPSWLHVDSDSRTLAGTPQSGDTGAANFELVATDESGSADMQVSLVVAAEEGPQLGKPILPQLEKMGPTSSPSTIFVYPGHSFSISFASDTFTNTQLSTVYYGTTQDNAPLPSWVGFDSSALKFSGYAPSSPSSGGQSFPFHLIASDVAGFSAATASFNMVVSPHILSFNHSEQILDISHGEHFVSPHFIDYLTLDGKEPGGDSLTSVDIESPDWISFDKDSISFSGTPPENAVDANVTITVKDIYYDVTTLQISLEFARLFDGLVEGCNATIGQEFMFVFNQSVLADKSVDLGVDLGKQLSSWLHYSPDNKTLYGHVPAHIHPQKYSIDLTAIQGSTNETRAFTINIVEPYGASGGTGSSSGIRGNKAGIIAISVVIPCVFLGTVLLLFCCWRRKRQATTHVEGKLPQEKQHERLRVVPELPRCQPSEESTRDEVPEVLGGRHPSPKPPKLELGPLWNADSFEGKEGPGSTVDKGDLPTNSAIEWDFVPMKDPIPQEEKRTEVITTQNKRNSHDSPVRKRTSANYKAREPLKPIQPRRSMKRASVTSSKSRRNSKRSSGISSVGSGLPMRISGAGHGAGGFGPPGYGVVRLSWQNPQAYIPSDESSLESLTPLFPRPPGPVRTRDSQSYSRAERSKRMSLRAIESRHSTISEAEGDPFEEFVQNRAKYRNSSNPMFSSQGNRRISSGVRALERARSTRNRRETASSVAYNDGSRQSTDERPLSTAMSASVYSDDHEPLAQDRGLSRDLSVSPSVIVPKIKRHSSVAQKYRDMAAPPPRFFSETSLASVLRGGQGDDSGDPENYTNLIDGRSENGGQRVPSWVSGYSLSSVVGLYQTRMERGSSPSLMPFPGKARQTSQLRFTGKDNEGGSSLPRDLSDSGRGDMAFV